MSDLYLLQFACCIATSMMSLMLLVSRFQIRWLNWRYELSRWLLCFSMAGLAVHYVLQMKYGLRASGDEVGAVVNILFYTPIAFMVSYATFNIVCGRVGRRRFLMVSAIGYLLVLLTFAMAYLSSGSLHVGSMIYVMLVLFLVCMFYFIYANFKAMRHRRRKLETETAADMLPYDRYVWSGYLLMCVTVLMLAGAMLSRSLLLVVGPLMLVALFLFTSSFIAFGFNIAPADVMLEEDEHEQVVRPLEEGAEALPKATVDVSVAGESSQATSMGGMDSERIAVIEQALERWCEAGGFSDSTANMNSLSQKIHISRDDLSSYFERYLNSSFRIWLSDIRFREAQRMLRENPNYSNDTISVECGFSSHAHLYKIFKAKTGLTPGQWKLRDGKC